MFETGQVFQTIRRAGASLGVAACLGFATAVPASYAAGHPGWQGRVAGYDVRRGAYFNIETKINPRGDIDPQGIKFSDRTVDPETFARAVARVIIKNGMLDRADIQSFDFRTPLIVQQKFPQIRTVYLFGDFPVFADPNVPGFDDGTNLQDEDGENTPMACGDVLALSLHGTKQPLPGAEKRRFRRHGVE